MSPIKPFLAGPPTDSSAVKSVRESFRSGTKMFKECIVVCNFTRDETIEALISCFSFYTSIPLVYTDKILDSSKMIDTYDPKLLLVVKNKDDLNTYNHKLELNIGRVETIVVDTYLNVYNIIKEAMESDNLLIPNTLCSFEDLYNGLIYDYYMHTDAVILDNSQSNLKRTKTVRWNKGLFSIQLCDDVKYTDRILQICDSLKKDLKFLNPYPTFAFYIGGHQTPIVLTDILDIDELDDESVYDLILTRINSCDEVNSHITTRNIKSIL